MKTESARILIADDERPIRRFLKTSLAVYGYEIEEAVDGQEAISKAASSHPDLLILDLSLPDMDGLAVIKKIREWSKLPIIILSVRESEKDKVDALDLGADDYLTKPFSVGELMARMRTALRHSEKAEMTDPILEIDALRLDIVRRVVALHDQEISLTPTEYELLKVLMQNAGKVLTHHQLLQKVWGSGYQEDAHLLRVNISNLRKKIEDDPANPTFIQTEFAVGYRFLRE